MSISPQLFSNYYKNKETGLVVIWLGCYSNFGAKRDIKIKTVKFEGKDPPPQPPPPSPIKNTEKVYK